MTGSRRHPRERRPLPRRVRASARTHRTEGPSRVAHDRRGGKPRKRLGASAPGRNPGGEPRCPTERWLHQVGRVSFGSRVLSGSGRRGWRDGTSSPDRPRHCASAQQSGRSEELDRSRERPQADLLGQWASAHGKERRAANEVARPRGRRTAGERDRRTDRTPQSRSRFGEAGGGARWVRHPGEHPSGTSRRAGFGPSDGWGMADEIAGLASESDPGARARFGAVEHQGETRASLKGATVTARPAGVLRHTRRTGRGSEVAGPASGPKPDVRSHFGVAGRRVWTARRQMELPQANLLGLRASARGKERRAAARGGRTGQPARTCCKVALRRGGAAREGQLRRLAGRRRLESR